MCSDMLSALWRWWRHWKLRCRHLLLTFSLNGVSVEVISWYRCHLNCHQSSLVIDWLSMPSMQDNRWDDGYVSKNIVTLCNALREDCTDSGMIKKLNIIGKLILTLISTPGVHVDPKRTLCEIFYDLFVIFVPNFMYSSPIHMSAWRLIITYLGLAQKPAPTILHWGLCGPQTHQFWKTMHAWVWLFTKVCCLVIAPTFWKTTHAWVWLLT